MPGPPSRWHNEVRGSRWFARRRGRARLEIRNGGATALAIQATSPSPARPGLPQEEGTRLARKVGASFAGRMPPTPSSNADELRKSGRPLSEETVPLGTKREAAQARRLSRARDHVDVVVLVSWPLSSFHNYGILCYGKDRTPEDGVDAHAGGV